METEGWVTVLDGARQSGLSHTSIYKAIRAGRLESQTAYGMRLVRLADLLAYERVGHRPRVRAERPGRRRKSETQEAREQ